MTGGLVLGAVNLMGGTSLSVVALGTDAGTDWGNPEPIETSIASLLVNGEIVVTSGWQNREIMVAVALDGNGPAMAAAEGAIQAELGKRNTLTYTPPATGASPIVFDVLTSNLVATPSDLVEILQKRRIMTIRLVCLPFPRDPTLTTVAALSSGSTTTLVDNGSSTTGWTAGGGSVSTASGAIVNTSASVAGSLTQTLTRAGSVTTSITKYLQIDWAVAGGTSSTGISVTADGIALTPIGGGTPAAGFTATTFQIPPSMASFTSLVVSTTTTGPILGTAVRTLKIDNINRTDQSPSTGAGRQMSRVLTITGSAPAEVNLALEHASSALGDATMIYTRADPVAGYIPAMRGYLVAPAGTSDAATVSGARNDLSGGVLYQAPYQQMPRGTYSLYARVRSTNTTPQVFSTTMALLIGGQLAGRSDYSPTVAMVGSSTWQTVCLVQGISVPAADVPFPSGQTVYLFIAVPTPAGGATLAIDEAWLFETGTGALTIVNCGSGSPSTGSANANRLWVNAPTADKPRWVPYIGFAADQSDAHYPGDAAVLAPPTHRLPPGQVQLFTVTPNATFAAASASFYRRFAHYG